MSNNLLDLEYLHDERHQRVLDFIAPDVNDKILVIGTGNTPRIEFLLNKLYGCEQITSGDIKPLHTETARALLPALNFAYLDAQRPFPFADASFDKVIFTDVLEHLKDEDLPLREIRRILRPAGFLILGVPKRRWFRVLSPVWWLEHLREYTESSIATVLQRNGFKIERQYVGGDIFEILTLNTFLINKYFLRRVRQVRLFRRQYQRSFRPDYKGKGCAIILRARPNEDKSSSGD